LQRNYLHILAMIPRLIFRPKVRRCISRLPLVPRTQTCASIHTAVDKPILQISSRNQIRLPSRTQHRVFKTLPLTDLVRTLTVLSVAGLPSPILSRIIHLIRRYSRLISSSSLLSWPLRRTFYDTFCIGETSFNIAANISTIRSRGITGVVLSFAREAKPNDASSSTESAVDDSQLKSWVSSNLKTIAQVGSGDYIAVKFTGAGAAAVQAMEDFSASNSTNAVNPPIATANTSGMKALKNALFEMCAAGQQKGVKIMVDAESSLHQPAIDYLTLVQIPPSLYQVRSS
jgi:proline dehydrogenase